MSAAPGNTTNNAPQADDKNGGGRSREYVERTKEMAPPEAIGTFRRSFQSSFISMFTGKPAALEPVQHNVQPVTAEKSVAATLQTHPKVQMHPLLQRNAIAPANGSKNSLLNMLAKKHNDAVQRAMEEDEEQVSKQEEPEKAQAFAGGAEGGGAGDGAPPSDEGNQAQRAQETSAIQKADAEEAPSVSKSSVAMATNPHVQREISPTGEAPKDTLPTPAEAGTVRNKDDPNLVNQKAESGNAESDNAGSISKSEDEAARESVSPKNQYVQASGDGQQGTTALQSELNSSKGKGNPLPEGERNFFESRMGADFSGVRIHTGSQAEQMNQGLGAHAFAHGGDIYFNSGKYQPGTSQGRHLLAHELTHTVQQGASSVRKSGERGAESDLQNRIGEVQASPSVGTKLSLQTRIQKTDDETTAPKVQAKCASCAAEEASVQKSEDETAAPKVQAKCAACGGEEASVQKSEDETAAPKVQAKCAACGGEEASVQKSEDEPAAPKVQAKCALCAAEEASVQKSEDETAAPKLSRTPHSNSALNVQPSLKIGSPGDKYEQEADSTADKVMSMTDIHVQRMAQPEEAPVQKSDKEQPQMQAAGGEEPVQAKAYSSTGGAQVQGGWWDSITSAVSSGIRRLGDLAASARNALLSRLTSFARNIPGYTLLTVVLGRDPISDQTVPRNGTTVIGGFMQLIGQQEKFQQLQESGAIDKAWDWLQAELAQLNLNWAELRSMFSQAWESLSPSDILHPIAAFQRIIGIFSPLIGRIRTFAGNVGRKVIEFVFEGFMGAGGAAVIGALRRAGGLFLDICRNPGAFMSNLAGAVRGGIQRFGGNILTHLRNGLITWLTGGLAGAGLRLPAQWDFRGILSVVLQVLGLTYDRIRPRLVTRIGERAVGILETGFEIVRTLITEGPAGLWEQLMQRLDNLQQTIIEGIRNFVIQRIIMAAITRLATMFNPVGAFVQAILAIYNTVTFVMTQMNRLSAFVNSVVNSISAIAAGNIGGAASFIEQSLARAVPLVIDFMARMIGLGDIAAPVRRVMTAVQSRVDGAVDGALDWVVARARAFLARFQRGREAMGPRPGGVTPEEERRHRQYALEIKDQLDNPPTRPMEWRPFVESKRTLARQLEGQYAPRIAQGTRISVRPERVDERTRRIRWTTRIAPNTTTQTDEVAYDSNRSVQYQARVTLRASDGRQYSFPSLAGASQDLLIRIRQLNLDRQVHQAIGLEQIGGNLAVSNLMLSGVRAEGMNGQQTQSVQGQNSVVTIPLVMGNVVQIFTSSTDTVRGSGLVNLGGTLARVQGGNVTFTSSTNLRIPKTFQATLQMDPIARDTTLISPEESELRTFLTQVHTALGTKFATLGATLSLDPRDVMHSEQAAWQALRLKDGEIAARIRALRFQRLTDAVVNIHTERDMCRNCALSSNHMGRNLAAHAPQTAAVLSSLNRDLTQLRTIVTSHFRFSGRAFSYDNLLSGCNASRRGQVDSRIVNIQTKIANLIRVRDRQIAMAAGGGAAASTHGSRAAANTQKIQDANAQIADLRLRLSAMQACEATLIAERPTVTARDIPELAVGAPDPAFTPRDFTNAEGVSRLLRFGGEFDPASGSWRAFPSLTALDPEDGPVLNEPQPATAQTKLMDSAARPTATIQRSMPGNSTSEIAQTIVPTQTGSNNPALADLKEMEKGAEKDLGKQEKPGETAENSAAPDAASGTVQMQQDESASPVQAKCSACGGEKIQTALKIGQPGDKYEQEADATADKVMSAEAAPVASKGDTAVQKVSAPDPQNPTEEEEMVQQSSAEKESMASPMIQRAGVEPMTAPPASTLPEDREGNPVIQMQGGGTRPCAIPGAMAPSATCTPGRIGTVSLGAGEFGNTSRLAAYFTFGACNDGTNWHFYLTSLELPAKNAVQPATFTSSRGTVENVESGSSPVLNAGNYTNAINDLSPNRTQTFNASCSGTVYPQTATNYARRRQFWSQSITQGHEDFHIRDWQGIYTRHLTTAENTIRTTPLPSGSAATEAAAIAAKNTEFTTTLAASYQSATAEYCRDKEVDAYTHDEPAYQALVAAIRAHASSSGWTTPTPSPPVRPKLESSPIQQFDNGGHDQDAMMGDQDKDAAAQEDKDAMMGDQDKDAAAQEDKDAMMGDQDKDAAAQEDKDAMAGDQDKDSAAPDQDKDAGVSPATEETASPMIQKEEEMDPELAKQLAEADQAQVNAIDPGPAQAAAVKAKQPNEDLLEGPESMATGELEEATAEAEAEGQEAKEGEEGAVEGEGPGKGKKGKKGGGGKGEEELGPIGKQLEETSAEVCPSAEAKTQQLAQNEATHDSADDKLGQTESAVEPPAEEGQAMGNASQVEEVDGKPEPSVSEEAAKQELDSAISDSVPSDIEGLNKFKSQGKAAVVGARVMETVNKDVDSVKGTYNEMENAATPAPPSNVPQALPETEVAPETPAMNNGENAVPIPTAEQTDMTKYDDESEELKKKEGISQEQLDMVDSGDLAEANGHDKSLKKQVKEAPTEIKSEAKEKANKVEKDAQKDEEKSRGEMREKRDGALKNTKGKQEKTKTDLEKKREAVTKKINGMYEKAKKSVTDKLNNLETVNKVAFDVGQKAASKTFEDEVNADVNRWKKKRYSGMFGGVKWLKDKFFGIADFPEVQAAFDNARARYIKRIDQLIKTINDANKKVIAGCKQELANAKLEIKKYVDGLGPELKAAGKAAQADMAKKLEELDGFINKKQKELTDKLCKAKEQAIKDIDKKIEAMKSEMSGLLAKLGALLLQALKKFFEWALKAVGKDPTALLNILDKGAAVVGALFKDPLGFLGNLVGAVRKGIDQFQTNIKQHLINGLVGWLTGSMSEVAITLPSTWDLKGILHFILQLLGLTWANLRAKLVKRVGEKPVAMAETGVDIVKRVVTEGPIGLWEWVKEKAGEIKEQVFGGIRTWIITNMVKKGIIKLVSMLNPAGAIVQAIIAIFDTVMFFVENWQSILDMVNSIFDSVANIAAGKVSAAATFIENAMAKTIPLILNFLGRFIGLSGIGKAVQNTVKAIRKPVDNAMDKALDFMEKQVRKLFGKKTGKGEKKEEGKYTDADREKAKKAISPEEKALSKDGKVSGEEAKQTASAVKKKHPVISSISPILAKNTWDYKVIFKKEETVHTPNPAEAGVDIKVVEDFIKKADVAVRPDLTKDKEEIQKNLKPGATYEQFQEVAAKQKFTAQIAKTPLGSHDYGTKMINQAEPRMKNARDAVAAEWNGKPEKADALKAMQAELSNAENRKKKIKNLRPQMHNASTHYSEAMQWLQDAMFNPASRGKGLSSLEASFTKTIGGKSAPIQSADEVFKEIAASIDTRMEELKGKATGNWVALFPVKGRKISKVTDTTGGAPKPPTIKSIMEINGYKDDESIKTAVRNAINLTVKKHLESLTDAAEKAAFKKPTPKEVNDVAGEIAHLLWASDRPLFVVTPTDIPRYLKVSKDSSLIKKREGKTISAELYTSIARKNQETVRIKFDGEVHHVIPLYLGGSHALSNLISVVGQAKGDIADSAHAQLHKLIDDLGKIKAYFQNEGVEQNVTLDSLKPSEVVSKFKDQVNPNGKTEIRFVVGTLFEGGEITYQEESIAVKKKT